MTRKRNTDDKRDTDDKRETYTNICVLIGEEC